MKLSTYYRGKIVNLFDKLFIDTGDARERFINCERQFSAAYDASYENGVPEEIKKYWNKMWKDLNTKEELVMNGSSLIHSSYHQTIISKKNKSLEKYLLFILEEYSRVSNNQ